MNQQEKQHLLNEIISERDDAFTDKNPVILHIQSINSKLRKLDPVDRGYFKDFVEDLKNRLFEHSVNVPGIDLNFFNESNSVVDNENIETYLELNNVKDNSKTYIELLTETLNCLKEELSTLKGYFLIKLSSNQDNAYSPILLHDSNCFYQPIQKKVKDNFNDCIVKSVSELKSEIQNDTLAKKNYLVFLILSTRINDEEYFKSLKEDLKIIIDNFDEFNCVSLKTLDAPKRYDIISNNDIDTFFDEISYVTSTLLINAELSNEEEKIIKKLFKDSQCSVLEYKVLKGGKSGSKVLEVRPKKHYATESTKRYIVKFCELNDKKKIFIESNQFSTHIEHFNIPGYSKSYEKNASIEGLKYTYASDDAIKKSFSFSDIIENVDHKFYDQKHIIIDDAFSSPIFEIWKKSEEQENILISNLYEDYIKPKKFFEEVKRIKNLNDVELEQEDIFKNFNRIFNLKIDTKVKVCHGDFHTENFFKNENGIYLIDFGFTNKRHAIIDHVALECSIKFKHIPFYIELTILEDIEIQLLNEDSFNATFDIKSMRKDIKDLLDIIKAVRINSVPNLYSVNSKLEYLISLFIMTCRQVQYKDLNQLYALKSAEIIANRIIQLYN